MLQFALDLGLVPRSRLRKWVLWPTARSWGLPVSGQLAEATALSKLRSSSQLSSMRPCEIPSHDPGSSHSGRYSWPGRRVPSRVRAGGSDHFKHARLHLSSITALPGKEKSLYSACSLGNAGSTYGRVSRLGAISGMETSAAPFL